MKGLNIPLPKITRNLIILVVFLGFFSQIMVINNTTEKLVNVETSDLISEVIDAKPISHEDSPYSLNATINLNQSSYLPETIANVTISLTNNFTQKLTYIDLNTTLDPSFSLYSGTQNISLSSLAVNESYHHSFLVEVPMDASSLDVVFLIDGSGSMGEELDEVKSEIANLINELSSLVNSLRVGFVMFGSMLYDESPYGDPRNILDFTSNLTQIDNFLSPYSAGGGWEPWGDALHYLNELNWSSTAKLGILITDEPCNTGDYIPDDSPPSTATYDGDQLYDLVEALNEQGIIISTLECYGANTLTKSQLQKIADLGEGSYSQLSASASGLIETAIEMCKDVIGEYGIKIETLINCTFDSTSVYDEFVEWLIMDNIPPSLNINVVPIITSEDGKYKLIA